MQIVVKNGEWKLTDDDKKPIPEVKGWVVFWQEGMSSPLIRIDYADGRREKKGIDGTIEIKGGEDG
ncbi:MAG: hypothetical protein QXI19_06745 [Candidatus Caldarchaeum sp.]